MFHSAEKDGCCELISFAIVEIVSAELDIRLLTSPG